MINLRTDFLGLSFKNPIIVASTDIGRSTEFLLRYAKSGVGGIITKSVTDASELQKSSISMFHITNLNGDPIKNKVPKYYNFFSRGGPMVSMADFETVAPDMLKIGTEYDTVIIASLSASRIENWVEYAKRLEDLGFKAIEINFGNPHGEAAKHKLGFLIGQSESLSVEVASKVVEAVKIPVIVKLTPQVANISNIAKTLESCSVKAVTVMHRFQGLMIDKADDKPVLGGWAAIGGPWMKPLSLANIAKVHNYTNLSIIGGNGADTARDVYEFLLSGASLVEIGSSMMLRGDEYTKNLIDEFRILIDQKGIKQIKSIVGKAAKAIIPYNRLNELPQRRPVFIDEACRQCSDKPCIDKCYFQALKAQESTLLLDKVLCNGCGLCKFICPVDAVRMENIN